MTWTSYNKPASISETGGAGTTFLYGADRSRFKQVSDNGTVTTRTYIGSLYEKEVITGGLTIHHHHVRAGSQTVSIVKSKSDSTEEYLYLHRDHLGSVTYITDASGGLAEELSYDPHGKRRFVTDWLDATTTQVVAVSTKHGFTGHEMLDDVGLVHMGGRVYDPTLGRFLSADPHVQSIQNPQALNRYSYVLNNPLSMTDPSGFFFKGLFKAVKKLFSKVFKNKIIRTVAAIVASVVIANPYLAGFVSGMISSGGDIKAGIIGALSAGSLDAIGGEAFADAFGELASVAQTVASGVVGGIGSELQGGNFLSGFAAAAFARGFAPIASKIAQGNKVIGTVLSAVSGGIAAELGGGKFANGAITGAFSYVAYHVSEGAQSAPQRGRNAGSQLADSSHGQATECKEMCHGIQPGPARRPMTEEETQILELLTDATTVIIPSATIVGAVRRGSKIVDFVYAPRVRQRALDDPISHNFPYSFDRYIVQGQQKTVSPNGYTVYKAPGHIRNRSGNFEIGVRNDGVIDHRFFRRDN